MTITIEKTNDESTIITSSNVSILLAAVDACSPFQFGISMITEVTTVRTMIAAISLARGMPRIGRHSIQGSAGNPRQVLQLTGGSCQDRPGDALPAPQLVDPLRQGEAGLTTGR